MIHQDLEKHILSHPDSWLDYPFGEEVAVYKVGLKPEGKMFALIQEGKQPLRVSLKCPPELAETLREKYESVLPGYHLNKKHWNTIICTGQLSNQQIFDLVDVSYRLVTGKL